MYILIILITILHVLAAAFLILLVLIQKSQEQGVGTTFGGGVADTVLGGSMTPLVKMTVYCAVALLITSVSLGLLHGKGGGGKLMPVPTGSPAATVPATEPSTNAVSTDVPVEPAPAATTNVPAPATTTTTESVPVVTPPPAP